MRIIKVTTKAQLDELYKDCSLAIEGLAPDEKNLKELLGIVKTYTPLWRNDVYTIEGVVMNRGYNLTGTNAYPSTDCTIVCIKLSDMKKPIAICSSLSLIDWQYFHEICDNNLRREELQREDARIRMKKPTVETAGSETLKNESEVKK